MKLGLKKMRRSWKMYFHIVYKKKTEAEKSRLQKKHFEMSKWKGIHFFYVGGILSGNYFKFD